MPASWWFGPAAPHMKPSNREGSCSAKERSWVSSSMGWNGAINPTTSNRIMTPVHKMMKTERPVWGWFGKAAVRHSLALSLWLLAVVLFSRPLPQRVHYSLHDERSTHIVLIPLISVFFLGLRRACIFSTVTYCPKIGLPLWITGLLLWYGVLPSLHAANSLSLAASIIV